MRSSGFLATNREPDPCEGIGLFFFCFPAFLLTLSHFYGLKYLPFCRIDFGPTQCDNGNHEQMFGRGNE
jgi:hypothetical protein